MGEAEARIRVWPPADWCADLNDEKTHMCNQPRGHNGDHSGPELPTVEIDESAWDESQPACSIQAKSNPRYCHLRGVRYNAEPCVGACGLAEDADPEARA